MIVNICLVSGVIDGFPDLKPKHNLCGESDYLNVVKICSASISLIMVEI